MALRHTITCSRCGEVADVFTSAQGPTPTICTACADIEEKVRRAAYIRTICEDTKFGDALRLLAGKVYDLENEVARLRSMTSHLTPIG